MATTASRSRTVHSRKYSFLSKNLFPEANGSVVEKNVNGVDFHFSTRESYDVLAVYPHIAVALDSLGLSPFARLFPSYLDLPMCANFLNSFQMDTFTGSVTTNDGSTISIKLTTELFVNALCLPPHRTARVTRTPRLVVEHLMTQRGASRTEAAHLVEIRDTEQQMLVEYYMLLANCQNRGRLNRVPWTIVAMLLQNQPDVCWGPVMFQEMKGAMDGDKRKHCHFPMLLTRILYFALGKEVPPCQFTSEVEGFEEPNQDHMSRPSDASIPQESGLLNHSSDDIHTGTIPSTSFP